MPCLDTRAREERKRGKHFEESHHIIQNTFRRLYTCVTWHTWPPNHSDTHLSGTTAPTRWILLLSSSDFLHATPGAHRQEGIQGSICAFTHLQPRRSFFLPSFLPSILQRPYAKQNHLLCVLDWNLQTLTDTFTAAASQNSQ